MPPVAIDPTRVRAFVSEAAFEKWLSANHDKQSELWLRIFKKATGKRTVTYAEALDVALCWGWIDGIRKAYDDESFVQRFTPRKPKSVWSQVNRTHVARLIEAGRMTAHGQRHVDTAMADGRWDAAYAPIREARHDTLPEDLLAAIKTNRKAVATFKTLNKTNLFALGYRTNAMKTPAGRARKIATLVAMLARGETIVPQR
ncbi:MAG: hypothetical protein AMXMBFR57_09940 [Acidimicrobiia bacterium]